MHSLKGVEASLSMAYRRINSISKRLSENVGGDAFQNIYIVHYLNKIFQKR